MCLVVRRSAIGYPSMITQLAHDCSQAQPSALTCRLSPKRPAGGENRQPRQSERQGRRADARTRSLLIDEALDRHQRLLDHGISKRRLEPRHDCSLASGSSCFVADFDGAGARAFLRKDEAGEAVARSAAQSANSQTAAQAKAVSGELRLPKLAGDVREHGAHVRLQIWDGVRLA